LNGYTSAGQLRAELLELKGKGFGSADIFDIGAVNPPEFKLYKESEYADAVPEGVEFMGVESVDSIVLAIREAEKIGVELGFVASSSYNAGGSWIKPEYANMALYSSEVKVSGPMVFDGVLPFAELPERVERGVDGLPVYWREVAVLAVPDFNDKKVDISKVIDISDKVDGEGRLSWEVPAGNWTVKRFVCTNTGQHLVVPSPLSDGLMLDHLNPDATEYHMEYLIGKILKGLGREDFAGSSLKYMYMCSYEPHSVVPWTAKFRGEFITRCGYDPVPYVLLLDGYVAANNEVGQRFVYDYRRVVADLLRVAHYDKAREVAGKYGLKLCSEAGGPGGPAEALGACGALDIMRGEFWIGVPVWVVKEIACAAHIYGKRVVQMEAFTSGHHWQDGPGIYKKTADRAFCEGANHFVFHCLTHNPAEAGKPGYGYYAGQHFNLNTAWWEKCGPLVEYLGRASYMLQSGLSVADVCYYYGSGAPNFVPPRYKDLLRREGESLGFSSKSYKSWKPVEKLPGDTNDFSLGFGYDYDVANAEVICDRMEVEDGKVVLPDGVSYEVLVLGDWRAVDLEVLRQVERLVKDGAMVVGVKPEFCCGLFERKVNDEKVREIADRVWGDCDGVKVTEHLYGKGKVIWGVDLPAVLEGRGIGCDFKIAGADGDTQVDFVHRRAEGAEIYFLSNRSDRAEMVRCFFRVEGKRPEVWDAETGRVTDYPVFEFVEGGVMVPLYFEGDGSAFVVFRDAVRGDHLVGVTRADGSAVSFRVDDSGAVVVEAGGSYRGEFASGRKVDLEVEGAGGEMVISGVWKLAFEAGWRAPARVVYDELRSWTEDEDSAIKYYSGTVVYRKAFGVSEEFLAGGERFELDLGEVFCVADVYLNGQAVGILWKEPYCADVTGALRAGENYLTIEVCNTWWNRLLGDKQGPVGEKLCHTNMAGRVHKTGGLIRSGLMGPVRVRGRRVLFEDGLGMGYK
jgi:hypothetical protein